MVKEFKIEKVEVRAAKFHFGAGYDLKPKEKVVEKKTYTPAGNDHTVASKMLHSYVDEVLNRTRDTDTKQALPADSPQRMTKGYNVSPFLKRVQGYAIKDIPLTSQVASQQALVPIHSTDKKKRVQDIANRLSRNDGSLVRCRLQSEGIDDKILYQLSFALPKNMFLQHLMLHDNFITDEGIERLCRALRFHPTIQTIWLGGNQVSDYTAQLLANLCTRNLNILDINISNKWPRKTWSQLEQSLHPHISDVGADYFARALRSGSNLTNLNLADQRVRDKGAKMLFRALVPSRLRVLSLKKNELTDKCCIALKDCLYTNPNLEKLTLSGNAIGDLGCALIAKSLVRNQVLQALDISDNNVGDLGLQALTDSLDFNHVLSSVSTVGNISDDERPEQIVKMRSTGQSQVVFTQHRRSNISYKIGFNQKVREGDLVGGQGDSLYNPNDPRAELFNDGEHVYEIERASHMQAQVIEKDRLNNQFSGSLPADNFDGQNAIDYYHEGQGYSHRPSTGASRVLDSIAEIEDRLSVGSRGGERLAMNLPPSLAFASPPGTREGHSRGGDRDSLSRGGSRGGSRGAMGILASPLGSPSGNRFGSPLGSRLGSLSLHDRDRSGLGTPTQDALTASMAMMGTPLIEDGSNAGYAINNQSTNSKPMGRREAGSPLARARNGAGVGTSGLRPRSRQLREGTVENPFTSSDAQPSSPSKKDGDQVEENTPGPRGVSAGLMESTPNFYPVPSGEYSNFQPYGPLPDHHPRSTSRQRSRQKTFHEKNEEVDADFTSMFADGSVEAGDDVTKVSKQDLPPPSSSGPFKSRPNKHRAKGTGNVYVPGSGGLKSRELGTTLSIPKTGNSGIMPIRSASSRHRDSGQHLMYLRIQTPNDHDGTQPYSILQVAKDREREIARVKAERQEESYKLEKRDKFIYGLAKGRPQRSAMQPPPVDFWHMWKRWNQNRYPKGIDHAEGCSSTLVDAPTKGKEGYDTKFLEILKEERMLGIETDKELPKKITTQAEAFIFNRREARVRRVREQKHSEAEAARAQFAAIAGLTPQQQLGDLYQKSGLHSKSQKDIRKPDFKSVKQVVY